jgi:hypothetical protein
VSRLGVGRPENCGSNLGRGKILSGLQSTVWCAVGRAVGCAVDCARQYEWTAGVMLSYWCVVTCWALWACFIRLYDYIQDVHLQAHVCVL